MRMKLIMSNKELSGDIEPLIKAKPDKTVSKNQFFLLLFLGILGSIIIFVIFELLPQYSEQNKFLVNSVTTYTKEGDILIDANLTMNFTRQVVEALENGIPLTIAVEVQVYRKRPWWRNIIVKESMQLFELRYHPLTDVHVVTNLANNEHYSFNSREEALAVLGTIRGAHLIKRKKLSSGEHYFVRIHTFLDINHLPPALRQIAALSSAWRLESSWFQWPVTFAENRNKRSSKNLQEQRQ